VRCCVSKAERRSSAQKAGKETEASGNIAFAFFTRKEERRSPVDFKVGDAQRQAAKQLSRRELLFRSFAAAAFLPQGYQREWGGGRRRRAPRVIDPSQIPAYMYRVVSVDRFSSMQNEYNTAKNNAKFGSSKAYHDQLAPLSFKLPDNFRNARFAVVVAAYSKNMYANFQLNGDAYRILVPFQYYSEDLNSDKLKAIIQKDIIKTPGRRVEDVTSQMPLKLLAARSGLGRYARNSLVFVEGMGSYNLLYAFLTDHPFSQDNWTNLEILNECNHCHACERTCPTNCISRWNYGANIDRCITLYNENPGNFPNWIYGSMHHALMGCMKCKSPCPANEGIAELSGNLEDVSEEETRKILKGTPDDALLKSLQRKLRQFRAVATKEQFPIMSRNLSMLIRA
jgi:epoxyqueuosine reductase